MMFAVIAGSLLAIAAPLGAHSRPLRAPRGTAAPNSHLGSLDMDIEALGGLLPTARGLQQVVVGAQS